MTSINLKQKKQLSQTVLEPTFNKRQKKREGERERRRKRERKSMRLGGCVSRKKAQGNKTLKP